MGHSVCESFHINGPETVVSEDMDNEELWEKLKGRCLLEFGVFC